MQKILRDFYWAELRGVLPLLLGFALLLGGLIFKAGVPAPAVLLVPAIAAVVFLRAVWEGARFRGAFERLPLFRQERFAEAYRKPHPCFPAYQGELHVLPEGMICRSRRTLLLLPFESLARASARRYTGRNRLVAGLCLTDEQGKTRCIEFLGGQKNALQELLDELRRQGVSVEG